VHYLERCRTAEGGQSSAYSFVLGAARRGWPISAAAIATLYKRPVSTTRSSRTIASTTFVKKVQREPKGTWSKGGGPRLLTTHLLRRPQAFYQAGDKYWDDYFPFPGRAPATSCFALPAKQDGSWNGDGIGQTYGTADRADHPPAALLSFLPILPAVREES